MNAPTSLWLTIPLALVLGVGGVGCNNGASSPTSESTDSDTTAEPETAAAADPVADATAPTAEHTKHHHGKSLTHQLFHAAKGLNLSDDQKTAIAQLTSGLHADAASLKAPEEALHAAVLAGVRAGNIDMTKIAPLQAAVKSAHEAHQAKEAIALNSLWSTLQPTQRTELVANIRAKQAERKAEWEAKAGTHTPGEWQAKRLTHLTSELALDDKQQPVVANVLASEPSPAPENFAAMKANRQAALDAFASDTFDARKLSLGGPGAGPAHENHALFLSKIVPILRADQRQSLAQSMTHKS